MFHYRPYDDRSPGTVQELLPAAEARTVVSRATQRACALHQGWRRKTLQLGSR